MGSGWPCVRESVDRGNDVIVPVAPGLDDSVVQPVETSRHAIITRIAVFFIITPQVYAL
jgi:hypothetical protein